LTGRGQPGKRPASAGVSLLVGSERLYGTGALSWHPRNGAPVAELAFVESAQRLR